jgi:MarR family transcriptional regulator, organic hydroperoxide resistance regulator
MKPQVGNKRRHHHANGARAKAAAPVSPVSEFSLNMSIGAQIKRANRAMSRSLQLKLLPYGIPIGMWYFLRALWEEDGLSQREVSQRVGATAATATEQLRNMELRRLIVRQSSKADRRKVHFFLTSEGQALKAKLLRHPIEVEQAALADLSVGEVAFLRLVLKRIDENLARLNLDELRELNSDPLSQDELG